MHWRSTQLLMILCFYFGTLLTLVHIHGLPFFLKSSKYLINGLKNPWGGVEAPLPGLCNIPSGCRGSYLTNQVIYSSDYLRLVSLKSRYSASAYVYMLILWLMYAYLIQWPAQALPIFFLFIVSLCFKNWIYCFICLIFLISDITVKLCLLHYNYQVIFTFVD